MWNDVLLQEQTYDLSEDGDKNSLQNRVEASLCLDWS